MTASLSASRCARSRTGTLQSVGGDDRTVWTVGQDTSGRRRLPVSAAAAELGTTVDALRKRVQRGTIEHERDDEGHVWILLDTVRPRQDTDQDTVRPQSERDELISELRAHNATLREQLKAERQGHAEARRLLLRALERIPPAIEAPESPESPVRSDTPPDAATEAQEATERQEERKGWLRRFFGL
jgi:hypothetical protein